MSAEEPSFAALVLSALRGRPGDLSEEELRDGLWLALQMGGAAEATKPEPPLDPRVRRSVEPLLQPQRKPEPRQEVRRETKPPPAPTPSTPGKSPADTTLEAPSRGQGGGGLAFRTPGVSALPGALALARALRPLRRRVVSQRRFEVDEEATARRISEARALGVNRSSIRGQVVFRPVKERWFELAVVVDGAASMAIWERTIRELVRLFAHLGAFRDVRTWTLDSEGPRLQLHVGLTRRRERPRSVREVDDPTGRRVIVVLTDGVAEAWRDGRAPAALHEWSAQTPVGLVSVLPEELWNGTVMRAQPGLKVRALRSGETRVRLEKLPGRLIRNLDPERFGQLRPIPVASLEPASMAKLAGMLTGTGGGSAVLPRLIDDVQPVGDAGPELSGAERVRRFDRMVSPEALRLARLFAAIPLFLPVMRLVQHTMLPGSNQGHLAEVFLGGLLEEVTGTNTEVDAIEYAFRPGVVEALRDTDEELADTMAVLRTVSRFVAERIGQPLDFGAALVDPTAKLPTDLAKHRLGRAFARISAEVLRPLGGEYTALAERLGSVEGPEVKSTTPEPLPDTSAPFRGRIVMIAGASRQVTQAVQWAAAAVGRGLARRGFGVTTDYFAGVDRIVVDTLVKTLAGAPAEVGRVRRERIRDHVTPDVCAAVVVGGAEGTWARVELARYLAIPVIAFAGTGGSALRIAREVDPDAQEEPIVSAAQAEAHAERLLAELASRVADNGAMPRWMNEEHLAALRAYAIAAAPDPAALMSSVGESARLQLSLDDLFRALHDSRPEVRAVAYLREARDPHISLIGALSRAVAEEVRAGVVVKCSGMYLLGLTALEEHCDRVTTLAEVDVVAKAARAIARLLGMDDHRGWVDSSVAVRATRLRRRALASPTLWVTVQAKEYESIRRDGASKDRTARLDEWAELVQERAAEDPGVRTGTLERQFQSGEDGRRALALACATGGTRTATVGMLYDAIKSSRSGFEQWLALNAALHWLPSAEVTDGVVGAVLEQVLEEGNRLNPRSNSDRSSIAAALLGEYGVRRGHGPGAQSISLRHRWLGEIRDRIGDDAGARLSFEAAIRLAVDLADEVHARVALGELKNRTGDYGDGLAELLLALVRTEPLQGSEVAGVRLRALLEFARLSEPADSRRWIEAAARWQLPDVTPENLDVLQGWGEQLLILAEALAGDRATQRSCYQQVLALAEFLNSSPDYVSGETERALASKARKGLERLGGVVGVSATDRGEAPQSSADGPGSPLSPLRLLLVSASPTDRVRLRVDREFRDICRIFRRSMHEMNIVIRQVVSARPQDLWSEVEKFRPTVLHISVHGDRDSSLVLQDDERGSFVLTKAQFLRGLRDFSIGVRLVVLNTVFSVEIARDIPPLADSAIGFGDGLSDSAAINFALAFYEAVVSGKSLGGAFAFARGTLGDEVECRLFPSFEDDAGGVLRQPLVGGSIVQSAVGPGTPGAENSKRTVLLVSAEPDSRTRLDLSETIREISVRLGESRMGNSVKVESVQAARLEDLEVGVQLYDPVVVHILTHSDDGGLVFEKGDGDELVSADALGRALGSSMRCVFLDSDDTAGLARELSKTIDVVVGWDGSTNTDHARRVAAAFYEGLGRGDTVEEAYQFACRQGAEGWSDKARLVLFPEADADPTEKRGLRLFKGEVDAV